MKRVFLFAVVFLGFGLITKAQKITGVVSDENKDPLVGVNISVVNSFSGTVSGADGSYNLQLKQGKHNIRFSYLGYETETHEVNIRDGSRELDVQMQPKAMVAEDVIVSATRASDNTPTSHKTLDEEEIEERKMVQDIPYLIQLSPSVVATSESGTGVGYTSFRVRGTDPTRVNITVDGIPYNDAESQGSYFVNMPDFTNSVKSVQIQRGVGTSTNGAGAFGATMNFKTKGINAKPYAELDAAGGSFNTLRGSVMAGTGLLNDHFTLDARYSKVASDGYVDRAFVDHESFSLSAAYRGENDLLKASIIHGDQRTGISWWGIPEDSLETNRTFNPAGMYIDANGDLQFYDGQTDNYVQTHYHLHYTHVFNRHLNINVSGHYTRGDGYYEQYQDPLVVSDSTDVELNYYGLPNVELGDSLITHSDVIRRKMMANDFYGGLFSLNYNQGNWDATFGGGWNKYDGDHFGEIVWMRYASTSELNDRFYDNTGIKTDANLYAKLNYAFSENFNAFGDVQYRHINYDMSGKDYDLMPDGSKKNLDQQHSFDFVNPKAGVFYRLNERMNAYASFALGNREPTRTHFKDATGDPTKTPKPETLYDYELGYQYSGGNFAAGINLYYMDYDNQLVPTGEKSSVGYDIMTNVKESYRRGIELMAGFRFNELVDWNLNATFSQNKILNFTYWASYYDADWNEYYQPKTVDETEIAYSPSVIASSNLRFHPFDGFDVALVSKYVGKQYFDNLASEQRMLDPYFVSDVEFAYNFSTSLIPEISLKFQINNVLNETYSNNAYGGVWYEDGVEKSWAYHFPQAGIHFMGGVNLKF
ncbi:MAG: TonB-dependent receptor [Bacteroidales bacterium]